MRKSCITAEFNSDVKKVWNVVTNNKDYSWRSDLSEIKILNRSEFVEFSKGGYNTLFTITLFKPYEKYEFDMTNNNFNGHWSGVFEETGNGGTRIVFTEELYIKNPIKEILSYFFMNLKKIQKTYIDDLRIKLGEE